MDMEYNVALLVFGILLLLVGLVGQVKAKEIEIGSSNPATRFVVGLVGFGLIVLSIMLSPAASFFMPSDEGNDVDQTVVSQTEELDTGTEDAADSPTASPEEEVTESVIDARVAVVSIRESLGEATVESLAPFVAELEWVAHDALQRLGVIDPDLIVVAADSGSVWPRMSPRVLRLLFEDKKIVGLGAGGAELFQALGANIGRGSAMHGPGLHNVVLANFPTGHVDKPALPADFQVHLPGRSDVLGIHDGGSPTIKGFEAFAHWPQHDHHWPVVRQGNLLLWGYDAPLNSLTEEGKSLLIALMKDHFLRPFVSFEERQPEIELTPAGRYTDRLTDQFRSHSWNIRLARSGKVRARVNFDQSLGSLALILNGPGQVGYFERKDGGSPLEIEFEVTPELLARGDVWRLSLTKFGTLPSPIDYRIELAFPE